MVKGQVFLKEWDWHFSFLIFSRFIIFTFKNYFTLCKIVLCILKKLLDPWRWPEVFYKIGSVRPYVLTSVLTFVLLSRHFLGIVSLDFPKIWHGARNSYEAVRDRAGFSEKICFCPKIWKKDPKWARRAFFICWKIWSLIFVEFDF